MQQLNLIYATNPFEKLFVEKGIELLFNNTIDSFRLRLHNPKTLIEELITVVTEAITVVLTNNDYVNFSDQVNNFLEKNKENNLIGLTVKTKDYLKAIENH